MNRELGQLLEQLVNLLEDKSHGHKQCSCNNCCSCTTDHQFENTAARFNEQAANAAALNLNRASEQAGAQFQTLLALTADITQRRTVVVDE